jgi:hypothetical protein
LTGAGFAKPTAVIWKIAMILGLRFSSEWDNGRHISGGTFVTVGRYCSSAGIYDLLGPDLCINY